MSAVSLNMSLAKYCSIVIPNTFRMDMWYAVYLINRKLMVIEYVLPLQYFQDKYLLVWGFTLYLTISPYLPDLISFLLLFEHNHHWFAVALANLS